MDWVACVCLFNAVRVCMECVNVCASVCEVGGLCECVCLSVCVCVCVCGTEKEK